MKNSRNNEAGNALWIILVAVALITALTITMTRSSDTTEQTGNVERARIYASEIMRFATGVESAVDRLRGRRCAVNDISFENSTVAGYTHTPAAATTCQLFHTDGGGLTYKAPKSDWLDSAQSAQSLYGQWYVPANTCVDNVGEVPDAVACNTDGIDNEDLVLVLPYITLSLCQEINRMLDIANPTTPPQISGSAWNATPPKFTGTYAEDGMINHASLSRKPAGCFEGNTTPAGSTYHFYQVLIAR